MGIAFYDCFVAFLVVDWTVESDAFIDYQQRIGVPEHIVVDAAAVELLLQ